MLTVLKIFILLIFPFTLVAQADFQRVKKRVVNEILTSEPNDSSVSLRISQLLTDGTWPDIDYDDVSRTGFQHREHLEHLFGMSVAYRHKRSRFYGDTNLRSAINLALEHWVVNDYSCDNWWFNELFTPRMLVKTLLLVQEDVDPEFITAALPIIGRSNLDAKGARPSGDRIKLGVVQAMRQLLMNDENGFSEVMQLIDDEVAFATLERGLQHDNSFHHRADRVNNTISYGRLHAEVFAEWANYVAGTEYAFSEEKQQMLIDYYLDGISRHYVYGVYADVNAKNRSVSRKRPQVPLDTTTPERLLNVSDYRAEELRELIALRRGDKSPEKSFSTFFWQTEYFVCQRPDWFASVRMFSTRNANMEQPYNSEGLLNHHRGDGAFYLHKSGDEYLNVWPVYDYQKIPGTTILQKETMPPPNEIQRWGLTDFVGAVSDGHYGAVGFDFLSPHDGTKARKAWFFFDEEIVCLGAGLEGSGAGNLVTTLEQAMLAGEVTLGAAGEAWQLMAETNRTDTISWVMHNGIGYRFFAPTAVSISNETHTGSWLDINKQWDTPSEPVTHSLFTLSLDHGPSPQRVPSGWTRESTQKKDVRYAYVVSPNTTTENLRAESPVVELLHNSRKLQAVGHPTLGLSHIIAYAAGTIQLSETIRLELDGPAALIIKHDGGRVQSVTAADPSRKLRRVHFSLTDADNPAPKVIAIDLPQKELAGSSVSVKF